MGAPPRSFHRSAAAIGCCKEDSLVVLPQARGKWMRNTARTLALVWALLWTLFGLAAGIGEGEDAVTVVIHTLVPGLFFIAAVVVAWWLELVGGVLLVLQGLWTLYLYPFARTPVGLVTLALPPLVAGILFLVNNLGRPRR